jgi:hypothetical protein
MSLFVVLTLIMPGIGLGAWLIGTTYDRVAKTETWKRAMSTLTRAFNKNPLAWVLAALIVGGLYGRYSLGQKLDEMCGLLQEPMEWSAGEKVPYLSNNADAMLQQFEKEDARLMSENSLQGDLWRWQKRAREPMDRACSEPETDERDRADF